EDGIRDFHVTGVQTCALPILLQRLAGDPRRRAENCGRHPGTVDRAVRLRIHGDAVDMSEPGLVGRENRPLAPYEFLDALQLAARSEERRVGKECRSRLLPQQ